MNEPDYEALGRFEHSRRELETAMQTRAEALTRAERLLRYANVSASAIIATPRLNAQALREAVEDALDAHQAMLDHAHRYNHAAAVLGKPGVRID